MEHLLTLYQQLRDAEDLINLFYGQTIIKPTLDRAMKRRHRLIQRIQRIQIRTRSRD